MAQDLARALDWDAVARSERARLVRLCARLTGDAAAAEDLAQEALLLGWRLRDRLRNPAAPGPWLAGIARRMCWRWRRARGRERARTQPTGLPASADAAQGAGGPESPAGLEAADAVDIEAELERAELAALLDRALATLPADTRGVLALRFVDGCPHAEIAGRLGLSEGAVAMRVQRGKDRLRRVLLSRFRDEALALGLVDPDPPGWEQTRIWCPECGARRLWARWATGRTPWLECWGCGGRPRMILSRGYAGAWLWGPGGRAHTCAEILAGVRAWKPVCNRLGAAHFALYADGVRGLTGRCWGCGRVCPVSIAPGGDVRVRCPRCGTDDGISASGGVAFSHPLMQAFWRRHGRIRCLPDLHVEAVGVPAVVYRIQSVGEAATASVTLSRDTLVPLAAHGGVGG